MKRSFTYLLSLSISLFAGLPVFAQLSCEYTLEMFDSFGDGWNGASLTITLGGTSNTYTVDFSTNNGDFNIVTFPVTDGEDFVITYAPGTFESEVTYFIYDAEGMLVYSDGPFPTQGVVFEGSAFCPPCPPVPVATVSIDDVRAFTADVSWLPSDPDGQYRLEYGPEGFTPGQGVGQSVVAPGSTATLTGLAENTVYELYITAECANGDTSIVVGPFLFQTLFANDVGIASVANPVTGCGLSAAESIEVALVNFGGQPQSLIPFNFSVNGVPGGVAQPQDGFYTGVLGKDSVEIVEFDVPFDFSEPGAYVLQVWTELDGDSVSENDTTTIVVNSIPLIAELPDFQDFESWGGGWTIGEDSQNPSWAYGQPGGQLISAAAGGAGAWVTNLSGPYNTSEFSYLVSPCLDFTGLQEDPVMTFSFFFDSESCCDEGWVEISTDDGESWEKLGAAGTGVNWYNDSFNNWWDGNGGFEGWSIASHPLTGTADSSDVRVRFVFSSDFSVNEEGMGIDNMLIHLPFANDIAAAGVTNTAESECGDEADQVSITLFNLGAQTISGFDVAYQINGEAPVIENIDTLTLAPGEEATYTFVTPFNSTGDGPFQLTTWTLFDDDFASNDTTSTVLAVFNALPLVEDFEEAALPPGWTTDEFNPLYGPNAHNTPDWNLADNIYQFDPSFTLETSVYGPAPPDAFLSFDYRYTNWSAGTVPTVLSPDDSLQLQISTDCGETYSPLVTINSENHEPSPSYTTVSLLLDDYVGEPIKLRFVAGWGAGDYWLDLDNINIRPCPESFGFASNVINESAPGASDGRIVLGGMPTAGFTFEWSDGGSGPFRQDLPAGMYTVTITNEIGCVTVEEFVVDLSTQTSDIESLRGLSLAPNPTNGLSTLLVDFSRSVDVRIEVFDLVGQQLLRSYQPNTVRAEYEIDLRDQPAGLYLIRLAVEGAVHTEKLLYAN